MDNLQKSTYTFEKSEEQIEGETVAQETALGYDQTVP